MQFQFTKPVAIEGQYLEYRIENGELTLWTPHVNGSGYNGKPIAKRQQRKPSNLQTR